MNLNSELFRQLVLEERTVRTIRALMTEAGQSLGDVEDSVVICEMISILKETESE